MNLGDRIKLFYENRSKTYLTRRVPVILRLDGTHFHSFCRGLRKPYDPTFIKAMQLTTKSLCESIQGCKFGYVESDEISLLLTDYDTLKTDAWFDYSVQKICSVAASMAAMFFNRHLKECVDEFYEKNVKNNWHEDDNERYYDVLKKKIELGGYFDARAFNLPEHEVVNYFIWRQNDATRNSIQGLAQTNFSQKQLQGLNNSQLQDKLHEEKGINWNDCKTVEKRGSAVVRIMDISTGHIKWAVDTEMPIISQNKDYIENIFRNIGKAE